MLPGLEQLTPEWLTQVLRREGVLPEGSVSRIRTLLSKTLTVSKVARLGVEYEAGSTRSAPKTFFLKQSKPARNEKALKVGVAEFDFYQSVGNEMQGPPLVRCFDAVLSPAGDAYRILLEDLSESHFQPVSPTPPSEELSELAAKSLARFHSRWWSDPRLGREIGTVFDEAWLEQFLADLDRSVNKFIRAAHSDLSAEQQMIYLRMLTSGRRVWGRLTRREGLTVTHGDMHWWNILYPHDTATDEVRLLDWQLWHMDLGARDLAFLVALGGFAERRRAAETHLVRLYYDTLMENGVRGYSWDDLDRDYRLSAVRNLNIPVIFWSQGKSRPAWLGQLERAFRAFEDLKCGEFI